ncbi:hypothetical protein [Paenibacillus piri]|uniref:hypothetical protein n=1 Tax=Paenibacillus piri TaxID=2547395 RepID=UPI001404A05A|nr:hypothetical protein [Paenibacillus piri]
MLNQRMNDYRSVTAARSNLAKPIAAASQPARSNLAKPITAASQPARSNPRS